MLCVCQGNWIQYGLQPTSIGTGCVHTVHSHSSGLWSMLQSTAGSALQPLHLQPGSPLIALTGSSLGSWRLHPHCGLCERAHTHKHVDLGVAFKIVKWKLNTEDLRIMDNTENEQIFIYTDKIRTWLTRWLVATPELASDCLAEDFW